MSSWVLIQAGGERQWARVDDQYSPLFIDLYGSQPLPTDSSTIDPRPHGSTPMAGPRPYTFLRFGMRSPRGLVPVGDRQVARLDTGPGLAGPEHGDPIRLQRYSRTDSTKPCPVCQPEPSSRHLPRHDNGLGDRSQSEARYDGIPGRCLRPHQATYPADTQTGTPP